LIQQNIFYSGLVALEDNIKKLLNIKQYMDLIQIIITIEFSKKKKLLFPS